MIRTWMTYGSKSTWLSKHWLKALLHKVSMIPPIGDYRSYVSTYKVQYSMDESEWKSVTSADSKTEIFEGNQGLTDTVTRKFDSSIRARFIRIIPITFSYWPSMRVELIGCSECPADVYMYNGTQGPLVFPSTRVGNVAISSQNCSSDPFMATRECAVDELLRAYWKNPITTPCSLDELETVEIKTENVAAVATALKSQSSLEENHNADGIVSIGVALIGILQFSTAPPDIQIAGEVVSILNDLLQFNHTVFDDLGESNITSQIILAMESYISALQKADMGNLTLVENSLAVVAVTVPREGLGYGLVFGSNSTDSGGDHDTLKPEDIFLLTDGGRGQNPVIDDAGISIQLPNAILKQVNSTDPVPISFFIYQNSKLFRPPQMRNQSKNVSSRRVIAATVEGVMIDKLDSPVITTFPTPKVNRANETVDRFMCVFWDYLSNGLGSWSSQGCRLASDNSNADGQTVCHCDHLTSYHTFGVIFDIHGNKDVSIERGIISRILLAISIVALIVTIVSFLAIGKCRKSRPKQIIICLSFSLLGLNLVFLTGIEATGPAVGCTIVAVLIHFFTLASVAWMAVAATNMYLLFVKVTNAMVSHFMMIASATAWGLPLLVVIIVFAVDHTQYINDNYCFLKVGNSLYYGHILIIGLVLLYNFVIFTLVMYRLTRPSLISSTTHDREVATRLKRAFYISILIGLTWVFGLLSFIAPLYLPFQVLFEVFNSLEGFAIFLIFCLREKEVRKAWIGVFARTKKDSQMSAMVTLSH
ncbi:adhesion G-protein coupled receptor G4-like isoform X2 [Asterias rubens]|uniref:adhesion G-protein coupled receptor G4-like isoform X2 n=1 Tax=Asterias rubens TaxID=7604 RepID=UPI001455A110|nr:adhesion G-protein coupled receptor G4-like isoform X2 [Asterias rubens]